MASMAGKDAAGTGKLPHRKKGIFFRGYDSSTLTEVEF